MSIYDESFNIVMNPDSKVNQILDARAYMRGIALDELMLNSLIDSITDEIKIKDNKCQHHN